MKIECSECGANLADNQTECSYCGAIRQNADQALLLELMNVVRKYETAKARGNKVGYEIFISRRIPNSRNRLRRRGTMGSPKDYQVCGQ